MRVDEHTITLDDTPVYYRSAAGDGIATLYVHGIPTSSQDWVGFLERGGGVAPDLIGFGRSAKGGHLQYTAQGLSGFLHSLLAQLGVGDVRLVAHGWGAVAALRLATADPDRVRRLVLFSPPPALPGFRGPWFERAWRRPAIGELLMGFTTRAVLGRALRRASASPTAWPAVRIREVWEQFDQGTQRAVIRWHRAWDSAQADGLEAALGGMTMPAFIVWGDRDPWCGPELAEAYASRLPQVTTEPVSGAGHWPWLDDPAVVDRVLSWLG